MCSEFLLAQHINHEDLEYLRCLHKAKAALLRCWRGSVNGNGECNDMEGLVFLVRGVGERLYDFVCPME